MITPIKLFLSSRTSPVFEGLDDSNYSLSHLRKFLRVTFEEERYLSSTLIDVIVHEEGFNATFDQDVFDTCLAEVAESDIIVILYAGDAGWAPSAESNGICHQEYLSAVQEHPSMTFGINLKNYFKGVKYNKVQISKNDAFQKDIDRYEKFQEHIAVNTVSQLQSEVKTLIEGYIGESIKRAFVAKKQLDAGNTVFGKTLSWSKLSYIQRTHEIELLTGKVFKHIFEDTICLYHAVPDHMSVSDARNSLGRPFLYEHREISGSRFKRGVIHFITVYGNVTESQVKNLIGFPDLTLIKTPFGYYLWEQTTQIQLIISSKCINPGLINTRGQQIVNWLRSSQEKNNIELRAEARYSILKSIVAARHQTK